MPCATSIVAHKSQYPDAFAGAAVTVGRRNAGVAHHIASTRLQTSQHCFSLPFLSLRSLQRTAWEYPPSVVASCIQRTISCPAKVFFSTRESWEKKKGLYKIINELSFVVFRSTKKKKKKGSFQIITMNYELPSSFSLISEVEESLAEHPCNHKCRCVESSHPWSFSLWCSDAHASLETCDTVQPHSRSCIGVCCITIWGTPLCQTRVTKNRFCSTSSTHARPLFGHTSKSCSSRESRFK